MQKKLGLEGENGPVEGESVLFRELWGFFPVQNWKLSVF